MTARRSEGKQPRSAVTLKRIVEAATAEFGRAGLDGATVERIARQAGVSPQLIYHYFGSKEVLYVEVVDQVTFEIHKKYFETDFLSHPPVVAFRKFVGMMIELNRTSDRHMTNDMVTHDGDFFERSKAKREGTRLVAVLDQILCKGIDEGVFRKDLDAYMVYMTLFLLIPGFKGASSMASRYLDHDFASKEASARWETHVLDVVMAYVCRPA